MRKRKLSKSFKNYATRGSKCASEDVFTAVTQYDLDTRRGFVNRTTSRQRHNDCSIEMLINNRLARDSFDHILKAKKQTDCSIRIRGPRGSDKTLSTVDKPKPSRFTRGIKAKKMSTKLATRRNLFINTMKEYEKTEKINRDQKLQDIQQVAHLSSLKNTEDVQFLKNNVRKPMIVNDQNSLSDLSDDSFSSANSEDKTEYYKSKSKLVKQGTVNKRLDKFYNVYDSYSEIESDEGIVVKDKHHWIPGTGSYKKAMLLIDSSIFLNIVLVGNVMLNYSTEERYNLSLFYLMCFSVFDLLCWLDIWIALNTPFYNKQEEAVYSRKKLFDRYLKGYLTVDVLSISPISAFYSIYLNNHKQKEYHNTIFSLMIILSLVRGLKLYKEHSLFHQAVIFKNDLSSNRFVKFLAILLVFLHFCSCAWVFIGKIQYRSWISYSFSETMTDTELYITALYFCLVTVFTIGYGDIPLNTNFERIIVIILLFMGVGLFSFLLSALSNLFSTNQVRKLMQENEKIIKEIRTEFNIPPVLLEKIDKFLSINSKKAVKLKTQFVECLPANLRKELFDRMFQLNSLKIEFFRNKTREFILTLFPKMINISYNRGEEVYLIHEYVVEMNIVKRGFLKVLMGEEYNRLCIGKIANGESIGEVQMHFEKAIDYSIVSGTKNTEAFILKKADFFELKQNYEQMILFDIASSLGRIEQIETNKNLIIAVSDLTNNTEILVFCLKVMMKLVLLEDYNNEFQGRMQPISKAQKIKKIFSYVKNKQINGQGLDFEEAIEYIQSKKITRKEVKRFPMKRISSGHKDRRLSIFNQLNRFNSDNPSGNFLSPFESRKSAPVSPTREQTSEALMKQLAESITNSPMIPRKSPLLPMSRFSQKIEAPNTITVPYAINSSNISINGKEYVLSEKKPKAKESKKMIELDNKLDRLMERFNIE